MTGKTITVEWYCGHYVGPPEWRWSGDWAYEPDECEATFSTQEDIDDYEAGDCMTQCPNCGAELWQSDSHIYDAREKEQEEVG